MTVPLPSSFFANYGLFQQTEVAYSPFSSLRDKWLQDFARSEPYLASVLSNAVSIDKNRAWTITGSERQVKRFVAKFHNFENGLGWRTFMAKAAQAYYCSDLGFVGKVEILDGKELATINNIPPQNCELKNINANWFGQKIDDYDLKVNIGVSDALYLRHDELDYIRVVSMPSINPDYNGLGYCAISRCVEWAQIMKAVYEHDKEQLLAKAPRGILLMQGVTQEQWYEAMNDDVVDMENKKNKFYNMIKVLASLDLPIDAKLIGLSQLPSGFDIKVHTDLLMYGYAMAFGYPADEFWPLQGGSFGHSREVEMNEQRSSSKGVGNFILDLQEEIQRTLPKSLHFEFSRRDTSGDIAETVLKQGKIDNVNTLFSSGLISRDEARSMLAELGVIPSDWTAQDEDITASDSNAKSREYRDKFLDKARVNVARSVFKTSEIVTYEWPNDKLYTIYTPENRRVQPVVKPENYRLKITDELISRAKLNGRVEYTN